MTKIKSCDTCTLMLYSQTPQLIPHLRAREQSEQSVICNFEIGIKESRACMRCKQRVNEHVLIGGIHVYKGEAQRGSNGRNHRFLFQSTSNSMRPWVCHGRALCCRCKIGLGTAVNGLDGIGWWLAERKIHCQCRSSSGGFFDRAFGARSGRVPSKTQALQHSKVVPNISCDL